MVGQEHVLRALINGLDNDRLHHAYLFTGTRGVGKTTLARILAKCLNCEEGVSSTPCNQCSSCMEIAEGRFVDLIEVDAASRTKVEDTRELLDNVQYAPTRGRYKVYLIDEVHMLSTHSFNALLKTLEEPPPHVKFLLATTDPHKLPVTILSRCLQFNLKNLNPERIVGHLKFVLGEEKIPFEESALWELGRAADGSMRDALSLTDQAIAHGAGTLTAVEVNTMLGTIDRSSVVAICRALADGDGDRAMALVEHMADHAPDYAAALGDMLSIWHQVAIAQTVPDALDPVQEHHQAVVALAGQVSREDIQLFYQMTLMGRKDLPYAADPRSGFEMVLLRLLAFRPVSPEQVAQPPAGAPARFAGAEAQRSTGNGERAGEALPEAKKPEPAVPAAAIAASASMVEKASADHGSLERDTDSGRNPAAPAPVQAGEAEPLRTGSAQSRDESPAPGQAVAGTESGPSPLTALAALREPGTEESRPVASDSEEPQAAEPAPAPQARDPYRQGANVTPIRPNAETVQAPPSAVDPFAGTDDASAFADYEQYSSQQPVEADVGAECGGTVAPAEADVRAPAGGASVPAGAAAVSVEETVAAAMAPVAERLALADFTAADWKAVCDGLGQGGLLHNTAINLVVSQVQGNHIAFTLDRDNSALYDEVQQGRLAEVLSDYFAQPVTVAIDVGAIDGESPRMTAERLRAERLQAAIDSLRADPNIQALAQVFNAELVEASVKPID